MAGNVLCSSTDRSSEPASGLRSSNVTVLPCAKVDGKGGLVLIEVERSNLGAVEISAATAVMVRRVLQCRKGKCV